MKAEKLSDLIEQHGRLKVAEMFDRVVQNIDRWSAEGAIVVNGEIYTKLSRRPSKLIVNGEES